ncbi:restriction endonuclease subunit S [Pseudomonas putida]|uniref:Type I restriction modification DNA specificity domain-containing protein n=1 Tax=Pseudomonas putida TaxID=303 RepID=A0A1Q9R0G0_PSEPU|nr:restriction endonuclease subunit S [Pseudomonas putida]OLS60782.1 hypothetical protein PSEMO_42830 [Pseudomonas putida]
MTSVSFERLGDVANFIRGITFTSEDVVPLNTPGSVLCLRTKNIQKSLDLNDVWAVDEAFVKRPDQLLNEGDILVSSANSWNLVGKCVWIPALSQRSSFGGFVTALRPLPGKILPRYLYWWFSSEAVQSLLKSYGNKTTSISNLNLERCLELRVPVLPESEQVKVAGIFDRLESIGMKRAAVIEYHDALMQSEFIDRFGRPEDERWKICRVDEAGLVQLGRQRAPKYQTGKFSKPYLRVANVFEDEIDLSDVFSMDFDERDYSKYVLKYGDILLNEGQSTELVGRPAMWRDELPDTCYQNTLVRFQANPELVLPEYALAVFLYYYRTGEFSKISSKTSSVAHLGAARFSELPFPVPPMELQIEFRKRIAAIKALRNLRTSLQLCENPRNT